MPKPKPEVETQEMRIRLDLTPEEHRRLRVRAAEEGKSMAKFAREVILAAIDKAPSKR